MVPHSGSKSRRWKWPSTPATLALSVARTPLNGLPLVFGIADLAVRLLPEALGPYPQQLQPQSEALFDAWPSYEKLDCKTPHSPDLRIECLWSSPNSRTMLPERNLHSAHAWAFNAYLTKCATSTRARQVPFASTDAPFLSALPSSYIYLKAPSQHPTIGISWIPRPQPVRTAKPTAVVKESWGSWPCPMNLSQYQSPREV